MKHPWGIPLSLTFALLLAVPAPHAAYADSMSVPQRKAIEQALQPEEFKLEVDDDKPFSSDKVVKNRYVTIEDVHRIYVEPLHGQLRDNKAFAQKFNLYVEQTLIKEGFDLMSSPEEADAVLVSTLIRPPKYNTSRFKTSQSPLQVTEPPLGGRYSVVQMKLVAPDNFALWTYQSEIDEFPQFMGRRAVKRMTAATQGNKQFSFLPGLLRFF
ncbi:MAG: hypothetical protein KC476_01720 [Cyanobacteria bacterium HKST-UBA06]|nr:hypothetical protein [Cyanobacteria bacterium HKST-UBA06]